MDSQGCVVVSMVSCDLSAKEGRPLKVLKCISQLHFGYDKAGVFAHELVHLVGVSTAWNQPAHFVHDAGLTECKKCDSLIVGNLLLKLVARQSSVARWAFDGQESSVVAKPHSHSTSAAAQDIALADVAA